MVLELQRTFTPIIISRGELFMARIKALATLLTLLLLTGLFPATAAASVWQDISDAQAAEAAGNLSDAVGLYLKAAEYFGADSQKGDPGNPADQKRIVDARTNAAIMYGHAGRVVAQLGDLDRAAEYWSQEAVYWIPSDEQSSIAAQRKADWVRSEVRLFVTAPAAAVGDRLYTGAKYEPVAGAYLGVYGESDPQVHNPYSGNPFYTQGVMDLTGRQHPIFLLYGNWSQGRGPAGSHIQAIKSVGGALEWALQPDQGLAAVVDGPVLRNIARQLREAEIPIFLRFAGEMNGDWVPWTGNPELYKEKFRLVARVMREEAPNVAMVWAPAWFPLNTMDAYYPGDEYVDWVGISAYGVHDDSLDPVAADGLKRDSRPLHDTFAEIYARYADRKPIMLVEGAVGYYDYSVNQSREPWALTNIQRFYAALPRIYPRVKAVVWFDSDTKHSEQDKGIMKQNYLLSGNERVLRAYQAAIADSYYLSELNGSADRVYVDAVESGVPAAKVELSSYVRAYDPFISRVEYALNGLPAGSSSKGDPWAVTADFSRYAGQTVTVTVRAYDSQGRKSVEQSLPVRVASAAVTVEGTAVFFDYQPVIVEGSLAVPLAQVAAATGTAVSQTTAGVTLKRGDRQVALTVGSRTASAGAQALELPVAPTMAQDGGRLLVPLRVFEALGLTIEWDGTTRTANLK